MSNETNWAYVMTLFKEEACPFSEEKKADMKAHVAEVQRLRATGLSDKEISEQMIKPAKQETHESEEKN